MARLPNKSQRAALVQDASAHALWLREHGLRRIVSHLDEEVWTGLLTAALLTPETNRVVLNALGFAGELQRLEPVVAPIDLLLEVVEIESTSYKFLEAKGYGSPSNAPGYRSDPNASWQTDRLHSLVTGFSTCDQCGYDEACGEHGCPVCRGSLEDAPHSRKPPAWFESGMRGDGNEFVVLDFAGRDMEEIYPGGICNDAWRVLKRGVLLQRLRSRYDEAVASGRDDLRQWAMGLVPLLTAGYADVRLPAA